MRSFKAENQGKLWQAYHYIVVRMLPFSQTKVLFLTHCFLGIFRELVFFFKHFLIPFPIPGKFSMQAFAIFSKTHT